MPREITVAKAFAGTPTVEPHCWKETMVIPMEVVAADAVVVAEEVNSVEEGSEEKVK